VIASAGVAAVIDPSLPPEVYIGLARERGWRIASVLDTHIHADHLSRARAFPSAAPNWYRFTPPAIRSKPRLIS
jgi:glyoxylase-like metal-dependent hydrolase (beta-lactamase superfamily II)